MSFSTRLKSARDRRDLSQGDLARLSKIDQTHLSHFESGRREPNTDNLRRLCRALDVTADYLLELGSETRRLAP